MGLKEMKYGIRNSKMLLGEVYFWTDTIKDWKKLLDDDLYKIGIDFDFNFGFRFSFWSVRTQTGGIKDTDQGMKTAE